MTEIVGGRRYYGEAIGILLFDNRRYPMVPGDVGNASSYRYPVRTQVVKSVCGVPPPPTLWKDDLPPEDVDRVVDAALQLQRDGVRVIVTSCGFFVGLQDILSDACDVPVFTSPLILVPLLSRMISSRKSVGILTASKAMLTQPYLDAARITDEKIVIIGIDDSAEFYATHMGGTRTTMDVDLLGNEVVRITQDAVDANPDIGAILVECSNLPTFSAEIQETTGLPVFDYIGFINFIYASVVQRRFDGFV